MSRAGTRKRKQRLPQAALGGEARPADAEAGLRVARFQLAGDDYVVLSYSHAALAAPTTLTSAEQIIFAALLNGQSNQQIAASRARSLRTVANQVAAIFQKLGVGSRAELFAKFSGKH
ncbi:MAG TPA: helix-turn-helix transcriptional regulator [Polyangiaceae bacterium]|jgi:DNA-binding NarL/FixJ family response regulator|nr:helix-turn-helix transcriptional regulator [Polyangiaceae bacterium]